MSHSYHPGSDGQQAKRANKSFNDLRPFCKHYGIGSRCLRKLIGVAGLIVLLPFTMKAIVINDWEVYGPLGGGYDSKPQPTLQATAVATQDGEQWQGCMLAKNNMEVYWGQKYKLTVVARGEGEMSLGVFEYPGKYTAQIIGKPAKPFKLTREFVEYTFEYAPAKAEIGWIRPSFSISGWLKFACVKSAELLPAPESVSQVGVKMDHFLFSCGAPVGFKVDVENGKAGDELRIVCLGPSGESGPGGATGGSGAWCDHYKTSMTGSLDAQGQFVGKVDLGANPVEGTYRLVVVDPRRNSMAMTRFSVRPASTVKDILALLAQVRLKGDEKIAFEGDSLTDGFRSRNYVSQFESALRWKFGATNAVFNAAAGGGNINSILGRIKGNDAILNADWIFLFEGYNSCKTQWDGEFKQNQVPLDLYEKSYRMVLDFIKTGTKAKVVLMNMPPVDATLVNRFDENGRLMGKAHSVMGRPEEVAKYNAMQKKLATEYGLGFIDMHAAFTDYEAKTKGMNPSQIQYLRVDDGVHLSEYGHREVFLQILMFFANVKMNP